MEDNINFYSLLIIAILAFLLPLLVHRFKRVKIPVVIAEIIAGIIMGKSGFNIIQNDVWIEFLSLFGFAYLMFLSGVEIDFSYFKNLRRGKARGNPLLIAIAIFLMTLVLSYVISSQLTKAGITKNTLFLTIIFSTTSLGVVVPTLKEHKIINEPAGQTILMAALIADFATMLLVPILMFVYRSEGSVSLLMSLIVFAAFAILYFLGKRYFKIDFNGNATFESSQLKIRAAFALILVFVSLAELSNVEIILGAFLAGILFSLLFHEFRTEIVPKLDAIGYGFLIPIFFISVGAGFNLKAVLMPETLIALPLFVVIAYVVKIAPTLILKRYYSWRETLGAGFLISSRLSLIIAIALVAWEADIIKETTYYTFILVAIITCIASPMLFTKIFPEYKKKREAVIIAGCNEMIGSLAGKISFHEELLILADGQDKIPMTLDKTGIEYIRWNHFSADKVAALKNTEVRTFVATYDEDELNKAACMEAKRAGIRNIVGFIGDPKVAFDLEKQGIKTVTPVKAMYTLLNAFVRYPESFEVLYGLQDSDNIEVREETLIGQGIIGMMLKELHLPGDCLVLMVSRDGRRIVPDGNTILGKNDVLVIIGSKEYMEELDEILV